MGYLIAQLTKPKCNHQWKLIESGMVRNNGKHTSEYSKIFIEWEDKNEKSEDIRREGKYHIVSYTYRNKQELDDNIQKISDLKNIFPYLSIKSSHIKYLKTL